MGSFKMRLLLIAASLALAAAAPTVRTAKSGDQRRGETSPSSNQSWQRLLLEQLLHLSLALQSPLSSRKETRALLRSVAWKTPMELKTGLLVVLKRHTMNGPGRLPYSWMMPGSAEVPSSQTSG